MRRDVAKEFFVITQSQFLENVLRGRVDLETPGTKIEAFLVEFPWVRNYVLRSAIRYVFVYVFELELMAYRSFSTKTDLASFMSLRGASTGVRLRSATTDQPEYESLVFVDEEGGIVASTLCGTMSYSETIGEVVHRLGVHADRIRYLLSFNRNTGAVIIYRVPKSEPSFLQWIAKQAKACS